MFICSFEITIPAGFPQTGKYEEGQKVVNKFRPRTLNSQPKCLNQKGLMVSTTFIWGGEGEGGGREGVCCTWVVHVCVRGHVSMVTVKDGFIKVATRTSQAYFLASQNFSENHQNHLLGQILECILSGNTGSDPHTLLCLSWTEASPEGSEMTRDPKTISYDERKEVRVLSKEKTNFIGFPGR